MAQAVISSTSTSTINVKLIGLDTGWHEGTRGLHWYLRKGSQPTTSDYDQYAFMYLNDGVSESEVQNFAGLEANTTYYIMVVVKNNSGGTITTLRTSGVTDGSGGGGDFPPTQIISHSRQGTTITLKYRNPNSSADYMFLEVSDDGSNFTAIADVYRDGSDPNDYGHPETSLRINSGSYSCTVYTSDNETRWFRFQRMYWEGNGEGEIYEVPRSIVNAFQWTSVERRALTSNGAFDTITASRFQALINSVQNMITDFGNINVSIPYSTIKSQNLVDDRTGNARTVFNLIQDCRNAIRSGGQLPAQVFNTIKYLINSYLSGSGVYAVFHAGDPIKGSYFIDIVNAMDAAAV